MAGWGHTPPRAPRGGAKFIGREMSALEEVAAGAVVGPGSPPPPLPSYTIITGLNPQERVASWALWTENCRARVLVHALA